MLGVLSLNFYSFFDLSETILCIKTFETSTLCIQFKFDCEMGWEKGLSSTATS